MGGAVIGMSEGETDQSRSRDLDLREGGSTSDTPSGEKEKLPSSRRNIIMIADIPDTELQDRIIDCKKKFEHAKRNLSRLHNDANQRKQEVETKVKKDKIDISNWGLKSTIAGIKNNVEMAQETERKLKEAANNLEGELSEIQLKFPHCVEEAMEMTKTTTDLRAKYSDNQRRFESSITIFMKEFDELSISQDSSRNTSRNTSPTRAGPGNKLYYNMPSLQPDELK